MKTVTRLFLAVSGLVIVCSMSACSTTPTSNADRAQLEKAQNLADRHNSRVRN